MVLLFRLVFVLEDIYIECKGDAVSDVVIVSRICVCICICIYIAILYMSGAVSVVVFCTCWSE